MASLPAIIVIVIVTSCSSFSETPASDNGVAGQDAAAADAAATSPAPSDGGNADGRLLDGDFDRRCIPRIKTPFFRASFDDAKANTFSINGITFDAPAANGNVNVAFGTPAKTNNAMLINTTGGSYTLEGGPLGIAKGVCKMTAAFSMSFEALPVGKTEAAIAVVGARNPAFDHCYVALSIDDPPRLIMDSHCGTPDVYTHTDVTTALPAVSSTFIDVTMTVDFRAAEATIDFGGSTATLDLGTNQVKEGGLEAYSAFGIEGTIPNTGIFLRLDSISVDVQ